ncbi:MAG: PilT/PilU family type 4a pilus ATPase [Lentisphaeria bacterium]|nr:PilT/PilU family type 4a pilus ATPase [Lentisphaeria bacterium]
MAGNFDEILRQAYELDASDIFFTSGRSPALRLRGEITFLQDRPPISPSELIEFRDRILSEAGRKEAVSGGAVDAAWSLPSGERFRFNFYTAVTGAAAAVRPIRTADRLDFESLALPRIMERLCQEPRGLILVTGSTGSGKSTTLAAMIRRINRTQPRHILTLEDPVEYLHTNDTALISQREVAPEPDGFAVAMRGVLRENPDVIVIGEMRDLDTVQAALNAAITGHLVISTLHTSDTVQSVERLLNLYPPQLREQAAEDLSMALLAIFSQRLIPGADSDRMIPAVEILLNTPTVRKAIAERRYANVEESLRRGAADGMIPFNRAVFHLYQDGKISLGNALRAVSNPAEFDLMIKGMERGVESFSSQYGDSIDVGDGSCLDMQFLLLAALENHASDLHLTLNSPPILRISGVLRQLTLPPLSGDDIQKLLYSVISPQQRVELEEKRELDFALSVRLKTDEKQFARFRVNAFFQRGALGSVARVVNSVIPAPENLNLPPSLLKLITKEQGLILVTGPTGSGKSTTLACLLDQINRRRNAKIITIEDPIEYIHTNRMSVVEQRELHADTLSFASALKYALRQDPDVIMVGEMRDLETIASAITAAETGHLVFATIHTNSAPQTVDRIVDSFPSHQQNQIRQQLASVLLGVVSQRLLPKVNDTGMIAAFEVMIGTPPVQSLIREGKTFQLQSVLETAQKDGMITLDKSMENLYEQGVISLETTRAFRPDFHLPKSF